MFVVCFQTTTIANAPQYCVILPLRVETKYTDGMKTTQDKKIIKEKMQSFVSEGYLFASKMREQAGLAADSLKPFTIQMFGKPATIVRGEEGVNFFYDESKIKRDGGMPAPISDALFGKGAVHNLDDEAHKVRKNAMADMAYDNARVEKFKPLVTEEIQKTIRSWRTNPGNIYDDFAIAYGKAAFRWAGIPMNEKQMVKRAKQYSHLLDTFGSPVKNVLAQIDRKKLDSYFQSVIQDVRMGELRVDPDSVVQYIADLKDENGELLDAKLAGIELQNLTRPTVAVSRFAAFSAVALVQNPDWAEKVRKATAQAGTLTDIPEAIAFAQEVRRVYPFVPMLPGVAKEDTEVSGCPIQKGQRVLIDIVGTHNSPDLWENAADFDPQRFMDIDDYEKITAFLPQGGHGVRTGHRCPGEKIAIAALSASVAALADEKVQISKDPLDTSFSWKSILTRPETGVRVSVK